MQTYQRNPQRVDCKFLFSKFVLTVILIYTTFNASAAQYLALYITSASIHVIASGKNDTMETAKKWHIDIVTNPEYAPFFMNHTELHAYIFEKFLIQNKDELSALFSTDDQETVYLYIANSMYDDSLKKERHEEHDSLKSLLQRSHTDIYDAIQSFATKQGELYKTILAVFLDRNVALVTTETTYQLTVRIAQNYLARQNTTSALLVHNTTHVNGSLVSTKTHVKQQPPHYLLGTFSTAHYSGISHMGYSFATKYQQIWAELFERPSIMPHHITQDSVLRFIRRAYQKNPEELSLLLDVIKEEASQSFNLGEKNGTLSFGAHLIRGCRHSNPLCGSIISNLYKTRSAEAHPVGYCEISKTHEQYSYCRQESLQRLEACINSSIVDLLAKEGLLFADSYYRHTKDVDVNQMPMGLVMGEYNDLLLDYLSNHLDTILEAEKAVILDNIITNLSLHGIVMVQHPDFWEHFKYFVQHKVQIMTSTKFYDEMHTVIRQLIHSDTTADAATTH